MMPSRFVLLALTGFGCGAGCTTTEAAEPTSTAVEAVTAAPTCAPTTAYDSDPLNCGVCGNVCASGLCYSGVCADDRAGHIFAIGNSYRKSNPSWDRILGNALFLKENAKVNVLLYRGTAAVDYNSGAANALARAATMMHRAYTRTVITNSAAVQVSLQTMDVLVIEPQPQLDNVTLASLADEWRQPIDDFTRRGGIVIVLDAPSAKNSGTQQVLGSLMPLTRGPAVGTIASVTNAGDQATGRVPLTFALAESVGYAPSAFVDGAASDTGAVLVAHRVVE